MAFGAARRRLEGVVQQAFLRAGLDLRRVRRGDGEHSQVRPRATYSPWNTDSAFREVYERASDHTLVDIYRCYELWSLVHEVASVPGALIEVGVWRGGTGALIAKAAKLAGIADPVYLCDTFSGVPKAGSRDPAYRGGEHADTSEAIVRALLARVDAGNARIVPGIFPDESAQTVDAERFRFAHVDVDTHASAKDCVDCIWPRLSPGGVMVFDDYGFDGLGGVRELVDELRGTADRLFVHNLNGHALFLKR